MFRFNNNQLPPQFYSYFKSFSQQHSYNTRSSTSKNIIYEKYSIALKRTSFIHNGPYLWNNLPLHLKEKPTTNSFKALYNKILIQNYS